jgi:iron complex outermembrane receptor protein
MQRVLRAFLIGSLLAASFASQTVLAQEPSRRSQFNIPAQSLDSALLAFADQADVQVVVSADVVKGLSTRGISGWFTTDTALQTLLAQTGLKFGTFGERTYSIGPPPEQQRVEGEEAEGGGDEPAPVAPGSDAGDQAPADRAPRINTRDAESESGSGRRPLEEIVVTGSHIRGASIAASELITIGRPEIDRMGFATTQQVLQSLPQSFGGGADEDTRLGGAVSNLSFGSGINLRGLGTNATLVLLNGRRLPAAGTDANFVDVSSLPLSAVERIEVLTDGASAVYGSDAVGGVVNVILRKDFRGAESTLRGGAATEGGMLEKQAAQLLGAGWSGGGALLSYEFYEREALPAADRAFTADSDLRPLGGANLGVPFSNPGNLSDPRTGAVAFAIPHNQTGADLTPSDLIAGSPNIQNINEHTDVLPQQRRHSVIATARHELNSGLSVFADARYGKRDFFKRGTGQLQLVRVPATNPFIVNPFGGAFALVNYSFIDDLGPTVRTGESSSYGAAAGTTVDFLSSWQFEIFGSFDRERASNRNDNVVNTTALTAALADTNPNTAFNPFGDGSNTNPATLAAIRGFSEQNTVAQTWSANAKADGTLLSLSGGLLKLAVGTSLREEFFANNAVLFTSGASPVAQARERTRRRVLAGFAELLVPLVGPENRRTGLERLEFSLAGRAEDYEDYGTTVNPKFGAVWSPFGGLRIRGTYGTSFKAPNLVDLDERDNRISVSSLPDPQSPTGTSIALILTGNNSRLTEETADTWSVGFDVAPTFAERLKLSATYFDIAFHDRIRALTGINNTVLREDAMFAPIVTRSPDPALVAALFSDPRFVGTPFSPTLVRAIVDSRKRNVSTTDVRGIDLSMRYPLEFGTGRLEFGLDGSYLREFTEALTETAPTTELVDTINNPVDLRVRGMTSWSRGGFGASAFLNYIDDYTDNAASPARPVDSWTTVDLQLAFATPADGDRGWLANIGIALTAVNVFDEAPPLVNNTRGLVGVGYDPENATPLGRFVTLQVRKGW